VTRISVGPEVVGLLADELRGTGDVIDRVAPARLSAPSPCAGWTVSDVVLHLVAVTDKFTRFARGETEAPRSRTVADIDADPRAAYRVAALESTAVWRARPDALARVCTLPFGAFNGAAAAAINLFDVVVHGWDIAIGAGIGARIDEPVAEFLLPIASALVTLEARSGGQYAVAETVGAAAPASVRLLAVTGRSERPNIPVPHAFHGAVTTLTA